LNEQLHSTIIHLRARRPTDAARHRVAASVHAASQVGPLTRPGVRFAVLGDAGTLKMSSRFSREVDKLLRHPEANAPAQH
jgi:hypothetical protein